MVRISAVLTQGAARYRVAVQARSIGRALEILEGQNPGCQAKVAFPIDPEAYFVEDAAAVDCLADREAA